MSTGQREAVSTVKVPTIEEIILYLNVSGTLRGSSAIAHATDGDTNLCSNLGECLASE